MVSDVATGTAFLEVVTGDTGQTQGIIKLSEGQQSGIGGDGGTVKFQPDFGVELEPEGAFSLSPIRCLQIRYAIGLILVNL